MLASVVGYPYALPCFNMGWYVLLPFDKYVTCKGALSDAAGAAEDGNSDRDKTQKEGGGRGQESDVEGTGHVKRETSTNPEDDTANEAQPEKFQRRVPPLWADPGNAWRKNMLEDDAMNQLAFLIFLIVGGWMLAIAHAVAWFWLWMCVATIPMARLNEACVYL